MMANCEDTIYECFKMAVESAIGVGLQISDAVVLKLLCFRLGFASGRWLLTLILGCLQEPSRAEGGEGSGRCAVSFPRQ